MNAKCTLETLTDHQIQALRREAAEAGDIRMACICEIALGGGGDGAEPGTDMAVVAVEYDADSARAECVRVINDAEAQR
jgi:hypothetical protein